MAKLLERGWSQTLLIFAQPALSAERKKRAPAEEFVRSKK